MDLPDSDRGDFSCRRAVDSSSFDIAITPLLRRVPVGQAYMARLNFHFLCK